MSKTPNFDQKVKAILDATQPGERTCALTGEKWEMTEEEISWYKKFNVPPSNYAPLTRMRILMGYFVILELWYNQHPETGKQHIALYHPASNISSIPDKEWFEKDYSSINLDYDSNEALFEQIKELQKRIPLNASLNMKEPKNSVVVISIGDEDSYFNVACRSKRGYYSTDSELEDSAEVATSLGIRQSYNINHSMRIFNSKFVRESLDCMNSAFLFDCRRCEFCFGATNKRNKKYLFFNEQLSQEEWEKRVEEIDLGCRSTLEEYKKKFHDLVSTAVWPENFNEKCEDCSGEFLHGGTNLKNCYYAEPGCQNHFWSAYSLEKNTDIAFCGAQVGSSELYYSIGCHHSHATKYCKGLERCDDAEYCFNCYNCEHCFGCYGLNRKRFHIFNKEYSEDDYWKKLDEIKCNLMDRGEYGEFFPLSMSGQYYPDTGAVFVYDASDEDAKHLGVLEYDVESAGAVPVVEGEVKKSSEVPDCIDDVDDSWAGKPLLDEELSRRFSYIKPELELYRRLRVAAPINHYISRLKQFYLESNIPIFEETSCQQCSKKFSVAKNRFYPARKIYCRSCYLKYLEQHG